MRILLKGIGMKILKMLALVVMSLSCAKFSTLNTAVHDYSKKPARIVWIQIAGLSDEQLALLKFYFNDSSQKTALEMANCNGKMWSFNLYNMRPTAFASMNSQIFGDNNIRNSCEDFNLNPIWSRSEANSYLFGLYENHSTSLSSLSRARVCNKNLGLDKVVFWKSEIAQRESDPSTLFHYQEKKVFEEGKIYQDKTCSEKECLATLSSNAKYLWQSHFANSNTSFLIVRDFSLQNALLKKDVGRVKEALFEVDKTIRFFNEQRKNDMLLLVTTASSIPLEFPLEGQEWQEFDKSGKFLSFKNASVLNSIWAFGPSSENYCGMFEESELLSRLFFEPKVKSLKQQIQESFFN